MSEETYNRILNVEAGLSELLDSILPIPKQMDGVEECLSLSEADLASMSATELTSKAYTLSLYSAHIQKLSNKETALIRWADTNINYIFGNRYPPYHQVKNSKAGSELVKKRVEAQEKADAYLFLSTKIDNIIKQLNDMARYRNTETYNRG